MYGYKIPYSGIKASTGFLRPVLTDMSLCMDHEIFTMNRKTLHTVVSVLVKVVGGEELIQRLTIPAEDTTQLGTRSALVCFESIEQIIARKRSLVQGMLTFGMTHLQPVLIVLLSDQFQIIKSNSPGQGNIVDFGFELAQ